MFEKQSVQIEESFKEYVLKYPFLKEKIEENIPLGSERILYKKCITQMIFADMISVDFADIKTHVEYVQNALNSFDYCKDIPDEIILDYVLPYRTNNEAFCLYVPKFYNELKEKVSGKTRSEAAKEVNFWCLSKATYAQADIRTRNAFAVYNCGKGRCGEESVFCVAALRSVGIPARQVYSPFWSHCDDNHAWVEAYTENGWEFMGACEPENILNTGWFNNASSRALAVRYRCFGLNNNEVTNDENHIYKTGLSTETYGKTHDIKANITLNGQACRDILVGVYIINYGMPCRILENKTNAKGEVLFTIGRGDFLLIAKSGENYDIAMCRESDNEIRLELSKRPSYVEINQIPSKGDVHEEKNVKTKEYLDCIQKLNAERISNHIFPENTYKTLSGYNYPVIQKFIENDKYSNEEKKLVLDTLTEKDFCDITYDTLDDIAINLKYLTNTNKDDFWNKKFVLQLRVKNEALYPHREYAERYLQEHDLRKPLDIYNHLKQFKHYDEFNYSGVIPDLKAVLKYNCLTTESLPIHFVQLCRTLGIPSEIDNNTNVVRYRTKNEFMDLGHEKIKGNKIRIINQSGEDFKSEEVTISALTDQGIVHFGKCLQSDDLIKDKSNVNMNGFADGIYAITASRREIDGSIYGYMKIIKAEVGTQYNINLDKIEDHTSEKLLSFDIPTNLCSLAGNNIIAYIENTSEPTEHFLNEILENRERLIKNNISIHLYTDKYAQNDILKKVLKESFTEIKIVEFDNKWNKFRADMQIGDFRLPFIVAVKDSKGLYAFANYNVGTVGLINKIFEVID